MVNAISFTSETKLFGLLSSDFLGNTKNRKIFRMVLTNQLSKRQTHEEDFFKSCVLLKKLELYNIWLMRLFQRIKNRISQGPPGIFL